MFERTRGPLFGAAPAIPKWLSRLVDDRLKPYPGFFNPQHHAEKVHRGGLEVLPLFELFNVRKGGERQEVQSRYGCHLQEDALEHVDGQIYGLVSHLVNHFPGYLSSYRGKDVLNGHRHVDRQAP